MRFDEQVVFPHPVQRPGVMDYDKGEFFDDIEAFAPKTADAPLVLQVGYHLKEPTLEGLVAEGKAKVRVNVSCRDTFFSEMFDLSPNGTQIVIDPSKVHNSLKLVTAISTTEFLAGFTAPGFTEDFSGLSFDIKEGEFLGFCAERVLYLEREAFGAAESVIDLVQGPVPHDDVWLVDAETDRIRIIVSKSMMESISIARLTRRGKSFLAGSIYTSAVQQALQILQKEGGDNLLWKRVFLQRCTLLGLDIGNDDNTSCSYLAQLILNLPLAEAFKHLTEANDED